MSPGIRSGVNCTRRVSTDSAPARVRTSSVFATPGTPSISTCPPHSSATSRPDTAASWPTTALATSARTAASRSRASCRPSRWWASRGVAHGRRTSLSSAASWSARVIRSRSVPGGAARGRAGRRPRRRAAGVAGDVADQRGRVGVRRPGAAVRRRGPARPRAARGGVAAVAGLAVEPAAAAGGLDRLHHHRQRLGGERPEPAGAPQQQRDRRDRDQPQRRVAASRAAAVARLTPSSARQVVERRDVPDQPVVLAEQPQRHRRVVRPQHLVVGERLAGAEQHQPGRGSRAARRRRRGSTRRAG